MKTDADMKKWEDSLPIDLEAEEVLKFLKSKKGLWLTSDEIESHFKAKKKHDVSALLALKQLRYDYKISDKLYYPERTNYFTFKSDYTWSDKYEFEILMGIFLFGIPGGILLYYILKFIGAA